MKMSEQVGQALARGYCTKENENKTLDAILILAMVDEIMKLPAIQSQARMREALEMAKMQLINLGYMVDMSIRFKESFNNCQKVINEALSEKEVATADDNHTKRIRND